MNRMADDALDAALAAWNAMTPDEQAAATQEWHTATAAEAAQYADDSAADAAHMAAYMAEAEAAQAAHIAAEEARIAGALVQVGPYIYADPTCRQCRGTGVVTDSVPYGMGNVSMDSPCECQVDYEWAVTDGDGITTTFGTARVVAFMLDGVPVLDAASSHGVWLGTTPFPTAAALLDACAAIAPLTAWAVVWDDQGADDAPRY